jgi:UDP-3-O-[3-hydroxymyristoyl] glucosamine N-acyltransferase
LVCVHASIGNHCVLSAGSIVEHDNQLGRGVFLHPAVRLAGGVKIGDYASLGIGACVIPYRHVGREARVQPGGIVICDVLPGTTVSGVPATRSPHRSSRFIPAASPYGPHSPVVGTGDRANRKFHSLAEHRPG